MSQLVQHVTEAGKTVAGGAAYSVATYCTTHCISQYFNLEHVTALSTLAASAATAIYFSVTTYIALAKWKIEKNGKYPKA